MELNDNKTDDFRAELLENFSNGFSNFLHRRKIKVADVARMLNLSHTAVSSWKNGKGFPDFITLVRLFYAGMNLNEVFGNELKISIIKNSLSSDDLNFKEKFEHLGDAAKIYPDYTLIIRKQFFDGVVSRFQDTIKTRTEMLIEEQKIRVGLAENLQKEYHKTFELKEEIRKQKYRRCLARSKDAETTTHYFRECLSKIHGKEDFRSLMIHYEKLIQIHTKWEKLWLEASKKYKQPLDPIEKDLAINSRKKEAV